jgi:ABC transport system ATP-binding/permease protein
VAAPRARRERPRRLTFSEKGELEELPNRIEALEVEQTQWHQRLADPAFYQQPGAQIAAAQTRLQEVETELTAALTRWEELAALEA